MTTFCHFEFSNSVIWLSSSCKFSIVYQISLKSDNFPLRYSDLTICNMTVLRHLEFYGSNNGFIEKPMYDFLILHNLTVSEFLAGIVYVLLLLVCMSWTIGQLETASLSAECSRDKPPFSFVRRQDLTMCDIILVSTQGHRSVSVSRHFLVDDNAVDGDTIYWDWRSGPSVLVYAWYNSM